MKKKVTIAQGKHTKSLEPILKRIWFPCRIIMGSCEVGHEKDMVITGDGLRMLRYKIDRNKRCIVNYNSGGMGYFNHLPVGVPINFSIIKDACTRFANDYYHPSAPKINRLKNPQ